MTSCLEMMSQESPEEAEHSTQLTECLRERELRAQAGLTSCAEGRHPWVNARTQLAAEVVERPALAGPALAPAVLVFLPSSVGSASASRPEAECEYRQASRPAGSAFLVPQVETPLLPEPPPPFPEKAPEQ